MSLVSTREVYAPALEDLSLAEDIEGYRKQLTAKTGEGWEEERSHYTSVSEINSLARTSYAPVRGCLEKSWLVSTEAKDDGKHDGEACVMLNLAKKYISSFKNFDSRSYLDSAEDMVEEVDG
jgi:hypothetical protein